MSYTQFLLPGYCPKAWRLCPQIKLESPPNLLNLFLLSTYVVYMFTASLTQWKFWQLCAWCTQLSKFSLYQWGCKRWMMPEGCSPQITLFGLRLHFFCWLKNEVLQILVGGKQVCRLGMLVWMTVRKNVVCMHVWSCGYCCCNFLKKLCLLLTDSIIEKWISYKQ